MRKPSNHQTPVVDQTQQTTTDTKTVGAHEPHLTLVGARPRKPRNTPNRNPAKSRVSLWPDATILQNVRIYCITNQLTLSQFFEIAAVSTISGTEPDDSRGRAPTERMDLDLDLGFRTDHKIRAVYKKWTEAYHAKCVPGGAHRPSNWTIRNDDAASTIADLDNRIIEIGILHTLANYNPDNGRIRSFAYYLPQINTIAAQSSQLTPHVLQMMYRSTHRKMATWLNIPDLTD